MKSLSTRELSLGNYQKLTKFASAQGRAVRQRSAKQLWRRQELYPPLVMKPACQFNRVMLRRDGIHDAPDASPQAVESNYEHSDDSE